MQLNLLTRLGQRVVLSRAEPPSTLPGAWRDSAISQLEALARANERVAARARRRRNLWALGLGTLVALWGLSLWRQASEPPRVPPPLLGALPADAPAQRPVMVAAAPAPPVEATVIELVTHAGEARVVAPAIVTDALPVVASAEDEAAAKARAQWLARRKAQLAQERARADEAAQQQRQLALAAQLEAERTLQQQLADAAARDRAAAAERERRQALLLAQHTRRGVSELCAGAGGLASEQHCQQRLCWKAEHQSDAVCVRLRDLEFARMQRGADH